MKLVPGTNALVVTSNTKSYLKWSGNKGYEDKLGKLYDFDDAVPSWHRIQLGSLLFISRDAKIAGLGVVHGLSATHKIKELFCCPSCARQTLSERSNGTFSCTNCKQEVKPENRLIKTKEVTRVQAVYEKAWFPSKAIFETAELQHLLKTNDRQSAIRELEESKITIAVAKLGLNMKFLEFPASP